MPSGRLCAANVASATSWIVVFASGEPLTENVPPVKSTSPSAASSRWAATLRALSTTFRAARCTATPPTTSDRDPYVSMPCGEDWVSP